MTKRIEYLDCLKAFAIFLVLFEHFDQIAQNTGTFWKVIMSFHMEIFFFISGICAPPTKLNYNFQIFSNKILARFLSIALPGIIVGTIRAVKDDLIENFLFNAFHGGYWFCFSLFLIFSIYWLLNLFLNSFSDKAKTLIFSLIILVLFTFRAVFTTDFYLEYSFLQNIYIDRFQIIAYLPFFLLGVIAKLENERFKQLIQNNTMMSIALIFYVIIFVYSFPKSEILLAILAIIILFRIFSMSQNFFSSNNKFGKILVYVGQRTLPIYLTHYFFIEGMRNLSPSFRELVQQNWFFEIIIISMIAIAICASCLAVEKVLQKFPLLHSLAFGFKLKKKL